MDRNDKRAARRRREARRGQVHETGRHRLKAREHAALQEQDHDQAQNSPGWKLGTGRHSPHTPNEFPTDWLPRIEDADTEPFAAMVRPYLLGRTTAARRRMRGAVVIYKIDPHEVEDLLNWFMKRGFTRQVAGPSDSPYVLVLFLVRGTHIDVAHVHSVERVDVARIPTVNGGDIYNPEQVVWHYYGDAVTALTALKNLPNPYERGAPTDSYKPPRGLNERQLRRLQKGESTEALRVNAAEREKLTIRISESQQPSRLG